MSSVRDGIHYRMVWLYVKSNCVQSLQYPRPSYSQRISPKKKIIHDTYPEDGFIRIAFVDSWLKSSAQGSGTAVGITGLQQALHHLGHSVTRVSPASDRPRNLHLRRLLFNSRLSRLLRTQEFDFAVGFDIDGFLYSPHRQRLPFVASIKGVLAEEAHQERGSPRRLLMALSYLERRNARHADLVLATSRYCQQAIERHYGIPTDKIRIVPEGIDLSRWNKLAKETPRQRDGRTILCVARQYPRKRIDDLMRSLVRVRSVVPEVRTIIVGAGPEHKRLRKLKRELGLSDIVDMCGELSSDDEVARFYRQADIFCLPSVQEGFGIVFLEAMANSLPIVATTATAIPEVVPDGQAGLLVPPRDESALATALIRLLRNEQERKRLGQFGRLHVRQYDWPNVAAQFLSQVFAGLKVSFD